MDPATPGSTTRRTSSWISATSPAGSTYSPARSTTWRDEGRGHRRRRIRRRRAASSPPFPPGGRGDAGDIRAPRRKVRAYGAPAPAAADRAEVPIARVATAGERPVPGAAAWTDQQRDRPAADAGANHHRPLG